MTMNGRPMTIDDLFWLPTKEKTLPERRLQAAIDWIIGQSGEPYRYTGRWAQCHPFRTAQVDWHLLQWLEIEADLDAGRPPRHEL